MSKPAVGPSCPLPAAPDLSGLTQVRLDPDPRPPDYLAAMRLANAEATRRLGDLMLLSWYDRDRNFESPQHASECHHGVDLLNRSLIIPYLPVDL